MLCCLYYTKLETFSHGIQHPPESSVPMQAGRLRGVYNVSQSDPQDDGPRKPAGPSMALRIGLPTLVALCALWAFGELRTRTLEDELAPIVASKVEDLQKSGQLNLSGTIATETVVSFPYIVFGEAQGKITVYVQYDAGGIPSRIQGFDYFLVRGADAIWNEVESGVCATDQCQIDGGRILAARGVDF